MKTPQNMNENYQIDYLGDEENKLMHFIFKKGTNNLLCVALNPKEEKNQLEITESLNKLAQFNGYDGWVLCFLNPKITSEEYTLEKDNSELNENYLLVGALLSNDEFNIKTALLCWGEKIEHYDQSFLKQSAYKIIRDLEKEELKFVSIGIDKFGNPISVSNSNFNTKFKKFDYNNYLENIKKTIKINPEITIDGIEFK